MNIPVQKLLGKIEEELKQARTADREESLREKIYSIKTLCELILDDKQTAPQAAPVYQATMPAAPSVPAGYQQPAAVSHQALQQPLSVPQSQKLAIDEANGDSLFDF